jgi:hypothetical protein
MEDYRIIPIVQGRLIHVPVIVTTILPITKRQWFFAYMPHLLLDPDAEADQDPIVSEED